MKYFLLFSIFIPLFSLAQSDNILIPYREGVNWGFCDTSMNIIVKPTYDTVGNFSYEAIYTIVKKNNKTGVFSRLNKSEIIPLKYEDIKIPYPGGFNKSNLFFVKQNNKFGIINDKNQIIIDIIYDEITDKFDRYEDNLISHFILKKGNKYGIADKNGKLLTEFTYDYLVSLYQPPSYNPIKDFYGKINNVELFIHIDKDGKISSNNINQEEEFEAVAIVGISNLGGEIVDISFNEKKEDNILKKYKIDKLYNDTIPSLTSYMVSDNRRYFKILKNNKLGILDINNDSTTFFKRKYETFHKIFSYEKENKSFQDKYSFRKIILTTYKNKIGIINEKEEVIFPFKIDKIIESDISYIVYQINNKLGIYNYFTKYSPIKPRYTSIERVDILESKTNKYESFDIYLVQKDGKWGYLGINGIEYFKL